MPDSTIVNDSTFIDLANRVLDMGESAVLSIAEAVENVAPQTWELLMRQVYVEAYVNFFITIAFAIILIPAFIIFLYKEAKYPNNDGIIFGVVATGLLGFIDLIFLVMTTSSLIKVIYNPEYYAAMKFFELTGMK